MFLLKNIHHFNGNGREITCRFNRIINVSLWVCKFLWNIYYLLFITGQSESPDKNRAHSPTPQTDADKGRSTHVKDIIKGDQRVKVSIQLDHVINKNYHVTMILCSRHSIQIISNQCILKCFIAEISYLNQQVLLLFLIQYNTNPSLNFQSP